MSLTISPVSIIFGTLFAYSLLAHFLHGIFVAPRSKGWRGPSILIVHLIHACWMLTLLKIVILTISYQI
jgi:hypothetical protein